jgi:histidine triad (HIT) family protein
MNTVPEASIFTKIINHEIPANIVYEDEVVIAFLTIEPINPGHTLVVPKVPFLNIFDGTKEVLGHMMIVSQKIAKALISTELGTGVNIIMNNGTDASQEVFHAHIHVVPRTAGDNALIEPTHHTYAHNEALEVTKLICEHVTTD